jgi:hypothetical protein
VALLFGVRWPGSALAYLGYAIFTQLRDPVILNCRLAINIVALIFEINGSHIFAYTTAKLRNLDVLGMNCVSLQRGSVMKDRN